MPLLLSTREGLCLAEQGETVTCLLGNADFLALARCPSDPSTYYAATTDGRVLYSTGGPRRWEEAGQIQGFMELSSLAAHPDDSAYLLAGMEPSALFRSEDGGCTWTEDSAIRGMSTEQQWSVPWSDALGHVRTIAIDPVHPVRIYLAIEVGGVVRTEDDGAHWENVHGGIHDDVHSVAVAPGLKGVVYAATRHGFGRSDDYGRTWRPINEFEGQGYCRPLAVDPGNPNRVFTAAATTGPGGFSRPGVGSECGIYRSDDGGLTWRHLTQGLPERFGPYVDALDVNPERPEHVALADSAGNVYQSDDGGDTWRRTHSAPRVRRLLVVP